MCLIVYKNGKDATFSNVQFKNMVHTNSDGLGIMWKEKGRIKVEKVLGNASVQEALWEKHKNKATYAMHARFRTHGDINETNCHPYKILSIDDGDACDMYLMHNGTINGFEQKDNAFSDTYNFVESVLVPIIKANKELIWDNDNIQIMVQKAIGASKLLIMRSDEDLEGRDCIIFNKDAGEDVNGCWLSNLHSTGNYKSIIYSKGESITTWPEPFLKAEVKPKNKAISDYTYANSSWYLSNNKKNSVALSKEQVFTKPSSKQGYTNWWDKKRNTLDEKVIDIKVNIADNTTSYYEDVLQQMKLQNDVDMIDTILDDPFTASEIIFAYYEKNTMTKAQILDICQSDDKIKQAVRLIRACYIPKNRKTA